MNGTLFDEYSRPKMAYYEVLKVLYEHLPAKDDLNENKKLLDLTAYSFSRLLRSGYHPRPTTIPTTTQSTITPHPPVTLADLPELPTWVEEYVHAYGGMVNVNGVEMDAQQLTDAIRQDPVAFVQTKQMEGWVIHCCCE